MKPRIQADVTRGELVWTIAGVFLLGTIFGWAAFGALPFPKDAIKDTSLAEFMAAAGTWVIGLGAWKYAREAHQHQVAESDKARAKRRSEEIARIGLIIACAAKGRGPHSIFQYLLDDKKDRPSEGIVHFGVIACQKKLAKVVFSDADKSVLSNELLAYYNEFDLEIETLVIRLEDFASELNPKSASRISDDTRMAVSNIGEVAANLKDKSEKFVSALKDYRSTL